MTKEQYLKVKSEKIYEFSVNLYLSNSGNIFSFSTPDKIEIIDNWINRSDQITISFLSYLIKVLFWNEKDIRYIYWEKIERLIVNSEDRINFEDVLVWDNYKTE